MLDPELCRGMACQGLFSRGLCLSIHIKSLYKIASKVKTTLKYKYKTLRNMCNDLLV